MNEPVTAELQDGVIWLWSTYRHKDQVKLVPGVRWDRERKQWRLPCTWAACKQLRGVFGAMLQVGPELSRWAADEYGLRVAPSVELRMATQLGEGWGPIILQPSLYPFQQAGVAFLTTAERCILADEMGTGKTVQAVVALRELHARGEEPFPALIVAPKSVKRTWLRELAKWCPEATVVTIDGGAVARRKAIAAGADVLVLNYETTWRHSRLAPYGNTALSDAEKEPKELNEIEFRTIIVDEAHRIKNPKAKQTRAVWWLGTRTSVRFRFALTGTPVAKAADDYWSILHLVDDKEFPAKTAFVDRYCLQTWNAWGGLEVIGIRPEMKTEFFDIIDPRMRRMPKDLVLPFLPPKLRSIREVEMTTKQRKAYQQMEDHMIAEVGEGFVAETLPVTKRLRLMQFASAYAELEPQLDGTDAVRLTFPSNKVEEFLEVLEELGDEPVVAFAQSRQLIELVAQKLTEQHVPFRMLVGGMTEDQREMATRDFQEGRARVMLGTIQAAGEGITLTRARHLVFLQRGDSMIGNVQAEDRVHRIGSEIHDTVHIIDIITPGTVEEQQVESLHVKFARLQEIVRDRLTLQAAAAAGDENAKIKLVELQQEEANIMGGDV